MSIEVRSTSASASAAFAALDDVEPRRRDRRARRAARAVGLGQDDAAAHHRRARTPGQRAGVASTARTSPTRTLRERQVGFVFQHYALFRHMTVFENVAFGLRVRPRDARGRPRRRSRAGARSCSSSCSSTGWPTAIPHQLSGGQRQRVALARALAVEPKVLLLDEPFGALDAKVRKELRRWLRRLHDEIHVTSVFVTHDQEEALEVADRVVVMNEGRIEQIGTPEEVYDDPRHAVRVRVPGPRQPPARAATGARPTRARTNSASSAFRTIRHGPRGSFTGPRSALSHASSSRSSHRHRR